MGEAARRPAQAAGLTPAVFDLPDEPAANALTAEWLALAGQFERSSYFQTPDWVLSWWETIAARPPTRIAVWRDGSGRLEAVVALSRGGERLHRRLPLRVPAYVNAGTGAGAADHCGWLVPAELGPTVRGWLDGATGRSALIVRNVDPSWPADAVLPAGARVVEGTACPEVTLPLREGPAGPSKSFVRQLRRFTRRLSDEGIEFEWVPPGDVDEALLTRLLELHAQGREGLGEGNFGSDQLPLLRRLTERGGAERGPAAIMAHRGAEIVGVLYGFWWRDTFAAYQSGWDRAYARHALGNVLILQALESAARLGARRFDFLRGTEPYKYRFGASDRCDQTWLVPRGPAGALLAARHRVREARR